MSYTVKISENENAVLKIVQDDDAMNPREEYDNFGSMICWHRQYNLGDKHSYSEPRDFLEDLASEFMETEIAQKIIKEVVDENFEHLIVIQDEDNQFLIVDRNDKSNWTEFKSCEYDTEKEALEDIEAEKEYWKENNALGELEMSDLIEIISQNAVILPLYLYDHSGITMNTTGFSCQWDSGQVGWTYATHSEIIKEYGTLDLEKAESLLKAEVETYDQYLTGDIYGFVLESKTKCGDCGNVELEVVDSCWGFYGLDFLLDDLVNCIGEEHRDLINKLS